MRNSLLFFKLAAVNQAYLAREGALLVNVLPLLGFLRDLEAEADALMVAVKLAVLPDVLLRPDEDVVLRRIKIMPTAPLGEGAVE